MRKYVFALILIVLGLVLFTYIYNQNNKEKYSEKLFSDEAKSFDHSFLQFIKSVEGNLDAIKSNLNDTKKIKDTSYTHHFFLNFLKENKHLISIGFFQDEYRIIIKKDKNSMVFAIDSTENFDIVRWERFENGKFISSWQESFDISISGTDWYQELIENNDDIRWFFRKIHDDGNKEKDNDELFYAGFSYKTRDVNKIILLEFSRMSLLQEFTSYSKYEHVNLLIETTQGKKMELGTGITNTFKQVGTRNSESDSLSINILSHFKRFDQTESGIFNFNFRNEIYWNAYKRFPKNTGIFYYLLTIPDLDLQQSTSVVPTYIKFWAAIVLLILGVLILFIKKRMFYIPNRIEIPNAKELIEEDENRYLEFKSSFRWDYRQEKVNPELEKVVFKTIAAFGNTDGGILLIGVDDDKKILGLEKDFKTLKKSTADFYEIHLRNMLHTLMGVKYVSKNIRMQFETCEDSLIICKIKVIAAGEPLFLKYKNKNGQTEERFYVRSGNSSQEIKSIAEINDYINTRFKK